MNLTLGGGLIENISEMGLRVLSTQRMAIGAELNIAALFVNGYELTHFTVLARVIWKNLRFGEDWSVSGIGLLSN